MKNLKVIAIILALMLACCAAASPEYAILAEAKLYDARADIDISADDARDQAKAVFTSMFGEFGGGEDVVFRIFDGSMAIIAAWESSGARIAWYENAAIAEYEEWMPEISETGDFGADYVLNLNTEKFHYPDCASVGDILEKNRKDYHGTRDEIIDMGYDPCGRCKP